MTNGEKDNRSFEEGFGVWLAKTAIKAGFTFVVSFLILCFGFSYPIKQFYEQDHMRRKRDLLNNVMIYNISGGFVHPEALTQALFTFQSDDVRLNILRLSSSKNKRNLEEDMELKSIILKAMLMEAYPEDKKLREALENADDPKRFIGLSNLPYSVMKPTEELINLTNLIEDEQKKIKKIRSIWPYEYKTIKEQLKR